VAHLFGPGLRSRESTGLKRWEVYANNPLETDHGRLKARLRPMRGLKRDRTASVIVAAHAFVQNLRRGFYDLGTDVPVGRRLAAAFAELAMVI
jgi:IS6 family transposase